jgi:hypothetical protein
MCHQHFSPVGDKPLAPLRRAPVMQDARGASANCFCGFFGIGLVLRQLFSLPFSPDCTARQHEVRE